MEDEAPKKPSPPTALPIAELYRIQVRELAGYAMFTIDPQKL